MKIAACYKATPVSDGITVNPDRTLSLGAEWEIGQYDLCAVEEAVRLAAEQGGQAVALTVGGEIVSNSKLKKAVLSRGPAEMFGVEDAALTEADSFVAAKALAGAVKKIGDVSLVICGEGSADQYCQQVGNILGAYLGYTTVNAVSKVAVDGESVIAVRALEDGNETLRLRLPAVISVTSSINKPRIPSMRDILGAGKKPSTVWRMDDIGAERGTGVETLSVLAPAVKERKMQITEGADSESISAFADIIRQAL